MATRKKTANTRGSRSNARRGKAAAQAMPRLGGTANDIVGLLLVVIAIAMGVALLLPSSAPVTRITGEVLVMLFGAGALLFPVALGIFALTFFIGDDEPLSGRVAFGLTLITLSVLSIVSITYPGAEVASDLVLDHEVLKMRGGYVGGGIAWGLLQTVGREVGLVVLIGTIVAGVVICGFSISDAVSRLKAGVDTAAATIQNANEERRARREERKAQRLARAEAAYDDYDYDYAYDDDVDYVDEPATTYLGSRTTTVLTRGIVAEREERAMGTGDVPTQRRASVLGEAVTTLLQRRPAVEDDVAPIVDTPLQEEIPWSRVESEPIAEPEAQEGAIPDFLQKKADKSAGKRRKATKRAPRKTSAKKTQDAAPQAVQQKVADANVRVDAKATSRPGDADETYTLPPLSMLSSNPQSASSASSKAEIDQTMAKLQGTLREFGLSSRVVDYISGPLVTTFRIEMGEGERVNKIRNLEDDIAKMPHMLVAGTTGSGKSVLINSMIMSLLMRSTPKQVRLIMVDPKRVEFKGYNGIPHLYVPVVTEPRQAASALQWAVSEMERRLKVFERAGARNITVYNTMCTSGKLSEMDNPPEPMPYLVIVIDELSDLMMVAGKDVEASIVRIAQLARAAGIHLVIATQRPSANVVTGLIKSNIDSRVALKVSSGIDSRVILDETGADRLLGNGDMLFKDRGLAPKRVLGCYASDPEIESVVDFIRGQGEPDYHEEILSAVVPGQPGGGGSAVDDEDDPLIWEAAQIVVESQLGSTSGLQRRLKVGYARAGRIMDMLESKGVVGPASGSKPREVLLDEEGLEDLRVQEEKYREV